MKAVSSRFLVPILCAVAMAACGSFDNRYLTPAPTVRVTVNPPAITLGQPSTITWSSTISSSCAASGSFSGSLPPSGSEQVTPTTTGTFTYTVTCKGANGSTSGSATLKVKPPRQVKLTLQDPNIPDGIIYSDFGQEVTLHLNCTGCQTGDLLNIASGGQTATDAYKSGSAWTEAFSFSGLGLGYRPRVIKMWITAKDNPATHIVWSAFVGSQDMVAQDTSSGGLTSGEIYYAYSGGGTPGSFSTLKYKQDGKTDGTLAAVTSSSSAPWGGNGIAVDDKTHAVLFSSLGAVTVVGTAGSAIAVVGIPTSPSSSPVLAVSAAGGLACATLPTIDSASCFYIPTQPGTPSVFSLPALVNGSQPTAIKVLDATHVVLYGRGDQTLRWYSISTSPSGPAATATGALVLSQFTLVNATYWQQYPVTGGWDLVQVGPNSMLEVMGQVINTDGTVSQELAVVTGPSSAPAYYNLPAGTTHIVADPSNTAVIAEYADFSGDVPLMQLERIYVNSGNSGLLQSTSSLVPGAGIILTLDGSHIGVFNSGMSEFVPNQ